MASTTPRPSAFNHHFTGCSTIGDYDVLGKLGEGTFGEVHKGQSKSAGTIVALKKILMHNEKDGFPVTAIREIKLLKLLSHVNVLTLTEMAVERAKTKERKKAIMYMVTPYMEHDLSGMLTNPDINFTEPQIKCYMKQLLEGLRYLHGCRILHRDMKAANLLISNKGILQIADFGLARHYDETPPGHPGQPYSEARRDYTGLVVTRWYRPPELLLGLRRYTPAIDLWGVGCVFGEMYKRIPILQGGSDVAQIEMIFDLVGSPTEENMPGWSQLPGCEGVREFVSSQPKLNQRFREIDASAASLLTDLLRLNWRKRITAISALNHPYFRASPPAAQPHELPVFEDSHELDHRKSRGGLKVPPPAPAGGDVGQGPSGRDEWGGPAPGEARSGRELAYDRSSIPGSRDSRDGAARLPPRPPAGIDRYVSNAPRPKRTPGWAAGGVDRDRDRERDRDHDRDRDRAGPPRGAHSEKDSYKPSYEGREGASDSRERDREPPPRRDRDRDERGPPRREYREERDDRRDHYRERDRDYGRDRRDRHYERDYERRERHYDDREKAPPSRRGLDYDEDRGSTRSRRTTRSRSPDRGAARGSDPFSRR